MDYTNDPDGGGAYSPSNEHPNAHDYAMLNTIYNHDDGFDVDGFDQLRHPCGWTRPPAGPQSEEALGDSPAEWGRAIHRDGQAAPTCSATGSGRKVITHVFWAIGEGPKE